MDPSSKKRLEKAFRQRDFAKCLQLFKKYFDDSSLDSLSSYIVGISYLHKFNYVLARKYLSISIDLDNTDIKALLALAALNLKQKNFEKATNLYLKIIEIDDKNKIAHKVLNKLKKTDNIDKMLRKMKFKDYLDLPSLNVSMLSFLTLFILIIVIVLLFFTLINFMK